eukprot:CAMPEP_0178602938 /NCGR_PEP_ID=MMETSP0697-20121206/35231_1 /TAXON_ID=265572 /ORGANISM="Extubocellulus spinifer, Strain CCMP396" /LENGTH=454 /DNA_ID=CAMNT_0020241183 /DNA_START=71 /DNA_END=1435 /DNA_ORIENTATION=-
MNSLPDDVIPKILAFVPGDGASISSSNLRGDSSHTSSIPTVRALSVTCRRYNLFINQSTASDPTLWKPLLSACYPMLTDAAAAFCDLPAVVESQRTAAVHRTLFLGMESMIDGMIVDISTNMGKMAAADVDWVEKYGQLCSNVPLSLGVDLLHHGARVPTSGTTNTSKPDADGVYTEPVYYDWCSNSRNVASYLHQQVRIGPVLRKCLAKIAGVGCRELVANILYHQPTYVADLVEAFIPTEVAEDLLKRHASEWFERTATARLRMTGRNVDSIIPQLKEMYAAALTKTIDSYRKTQTCDFDMADFLIVVTDVMDADCEDFLSNCYKRNHGTLFSDLVLVFVCCGEPTLKLTEELLKKDGRLQSTLNRITRSGVFVPLTLKLAELASPQGTVLSVYASDESYVVVDEERNILYDTDGYYHGVPAAEALSRARDQPQLSSDRFDFTLGGLRRSGA